MTAVAEPRLTARQWAAIMRAPLKDRSYQLTKAGSSVTAFLAFKQLSRRSERTLDSIERTLARLVTLHPEKTMGDYASEDILDFLIAFNPASRPKHRSHLAEWFRWAVAWEHIPKDPMLRIPEIRRDPATVPLIFDEREQELLCALPELHDRALMLILLGSGIRDGEARALTFGDVDLDGRRLKVRGKGHRQRIVPIPPRVAHALADLQILEGLNPGDYLWYRRRGNANWQGPTLRDRQIAYSGFHAWWVRCLNEAGVTLRKPHMTRHTFATWYLRAGGKIERLSRILGHSSIAVTSSHYAHLTVDDLAEDADRVMVARGWGEE